LPYAKGWASLYYRRFLHDSAMNCAVYASAHAIFGTRITPSSRRLCMFACRYHAMIYVGLTPSASLAGLSSKWPPRKGPRQGSICPKLQEMQVSRHMSHHFAHKRSEIAHVAVNFREPGSHGMHAGSPWSLPRPCEPARRIYEHASCVSLCTCVCVCVSMCTCTQ
jgi:hypothetical protein